MSEMDHEALAKTALDRAFAASKHDDSHTGYAAVAQAHAALAMVAKLGRIADELHTSNLLLASGAAPVPRDGQRAAARALERLGIPGPLTGAQ